VCDKLVLLLVHMRSPTLYVFLFMMVWLTIR